MRALVAMLSMAALTLAVPAAAQDHAARVARVLKRTPLIDGHNDWPDALRTMEGEGRWTADLHHLKGTPIPYDTDIARLRQGMVGGQFWSVWVSPTLPGDEQVRRTIEQIDLVHAIVARYPETFALARTADDVRRAHREGRIASMIGIEGGGQINNSLSVLRALHDLGAGYLTLTHVLTIDWADSATDDPKHGGLTPFGEDVVRELNRLGMLVDLSHVSPDTMRAALRVTKAPVIFSHSSARALDDHPRDVPDDVLRLVKANGGIVMVCFAPLYVSDEYRRWSADRAAEQTRLNAPPYGGLFIGQPDKAKAAMAEWLAAHPEPKATLSQVADHIEHVAKVAGVDHVGIGSDFDGTGGSVSVGLEDVSRYPRLLEELMRRGWSDADIEKLAGANILRVMAAAEHVAATIRATAH